MALDPSIYVALIALAGAIIVALLGRDKYGKNDAVLLEARLTSIENTIDTKLEPIWDAIMKELPKILISPHTPKLDALLEKALDVGFKNLQPEDATQIRVQLDRHYEVEENPMKRLTVSLIKIALSVEGRQDILRPV